MTFRGAAIALRAGRAGARVACVLLGLLASSCGRRAAESATASEASVADTVHVAPEEETFFTDLGEGFPELDALTPESRAAVVARANRAKCDCGCWGHSVNACLHQKEACEIARRTAAAFLADAALAEKLAGTPEAAPLPADGDAPPPEGEAPAGEPAAEGDAAPAEGEAPADADAPAEAGQPATTGTVADAPLVPVPDPAAAPGAAAAGTVAAPPAPAPEPPAPAPASPKASETEPASPKAGAP